MNEAFSAEEEEILNDIRSRITGFGRERKNLIPILQMIQEMHAYLPADAI